METAAISCPQTKNRINEMVDVGRESRSYYNF